MTRPKCTEPILRSRTGEQPPNTTCKRYAVEGSQWCKPHKEAHEKGTAVTDSELFGPARAGYGQEGIR